MDLALSHLSCAVQMVMADPDERARIPAQAPGTDWVDAFSELHFEFLNNSSVKQFDAIQQSNAFCYYPPAANHPCMLGWRQP